MEQGFSARTMVTNVNKHALVHRDRSMFALIEQKGLICQLPPEDHLFNIV